MKTTLVIADDHPIVLAGIRQALQEECGLHVAAEADTPEALLSMIEQHTPDVVVTDYSMPGVSDIPDGATLVSLIHRRHPGIKIVILTMIENPPLISQMLAAGASAVVPKSQGLNQLVTTLRRVIANHPAPPSLQHQAQKLDGIGQSLSPREMEVVRLFANGMTVGQIASHLHRSNKTVSTQKITAMRKLGLQSDPELIAYCIQHGITN